VEHIKTTRQPSFMPLHVWRDGVNGRALKADEGELPVDSDYQRGVSIRNPTIIFCQKVSRHAGIIRRSTQLCYLPTYGPRGLG
jgi:hypothetical protein